MRILEVKNWKKFALDRAEWAKASEEGQEPLGAVELITIIIIMMMMILPKHPLSYLIITPSHAYLQVSLKD